MEAATPRLGILGGSFDPPHLGHLAMASEVCARLQLERVLFVPAAAPPHKEGERRTAAPARLAMTELAVQEDTRFVVSGIEIARGIVYTRDTLEAVAERFPGHDLVFIMGADSLLQFDTWQEPEGILARGLVAVVQRPGVDGRAVAASAARWGTHRVRVLDAPFLDISSSDIRDRIVKALPIKYLVPDAVVDYITEHGLYRRP